MPSRPVPGSSPGATRLWRITASSVKPPVHRWVYLTAHNQLMTDLLDDLRAKSDRYRGPGV